MYKLLDILYEIKTIGKVTPEQVIDVYNKVFMLGPSVYKDLADILHKYGRNKTNIRLQIDWVKSLSNNDLINYYSDLVKLNNKHKLQEIKVIGNGPNFDRKNSWYKVIGLSGYPPNMHVLVYDCGPYYCFGLGSLSLYDKKKHKNIQIIEKKPDGVILNKARENYKRFYEEGKYEIQ